jgi:hypothetical protein
MEGDRIMDKFFFPLGDGYYYGRRLHKELKEILGGKLIQSPHATGLLCQAIYNSGEGDYIEIGSLYGGSAITAALTKKEFKLDGRILCIEPSQRDIFTHADQFGVSDLIDLIEAPSNEVMLNKTFACGFIDGDHRSPHPINDFIRINKRVTNYIIFDDYDKSEPGVVSAVHEVLESFYDWQLSHCSDAIVILERIR